VDERSALQQEPATGRVLAQYVALALAWGSSFLLIKIGLDGLSPTQVVLGRLVAGALALGAITAVTGQALPREPAVYAHLGVVAVLLCVVPFTLFAWAEERISSGLASIYNATTPLMTALVALALLPSERLTRARAVGLATGFVGVVVVLGPWQGLGGGTALAQVACLGATASYGLAFVHLRRWISPRGLGAVPVATVQVGLAAVLALVLAPLVATEPVQLTARVVLAVLVLGVVGTGFAYVWNTGVVAGWGATGASTVTYLTPLVGVVLGVAVLGEDVAWHQPVGALVVVLGIVVSQGRLVPLVPRAGR
jgi:drug/metabolite transporter (DMT)-like permease